MTNSSADMFPRPTDTLFTASDYDALAAIVFRPDYPGFATARGVVEAPGGRSHERDTEKRYSHVATKYLANETRPRRKMLEAYLEEAWSRALSICDNVFGEQPEGFYPSWQHGCLRVLEYPADAGSAEHTDFDLFTINCYRNTSNPGLGTEEVHMGELGEMLGLGRARRHSVLPSEHTQHSVVYFAVPDHAAVLPGGTTVGAWIEERKERSRYKAAP